MLRVLYAMVAPLLACQTSVVCGLGYSAFMSHRSMKCAVCGERTRLRVTRYVAPLSLQVTHKSVTGDYRRQASIPAQARYECMACGILMEHGVSELTDQQLKALGYPA